MSKLTAGLILAALLVLLILRVFFWLAGKAIAWVLRQ